jgi:arylsulfatase A-like enzyme
MISAMDEAIGAVVAKLKELNLYDNTIIVMLGDNGAPNQVGLQSVQCVQLYIKHINIGSYSNQYILH